jgi:hypothetical protein
MAVPGFPKSLGRVKRLLVTEQAPDNHFITGSSGIAMAKKTCSLLDVHKPLNPWLETGMRLIIRRRLSREQVLSR